MMLCYTKQTELVPPVPTPELIASTDATVKTFIQWYLESFQTQATQTRHAPREFTE